ncbi:MAG: hypothetical protein U0992_24350 [Planctomycetaceae bacterium]
MPATEQYWRPLGTVHKVFAGSALVLLISTLVMTEFDQNREWKSYQRENERLKFEQLQKERAGLTAGTYETQLAALEKNISDARKRGSRTNRRRSPGWRENSAT